MGSPQKANPFFYFSNSTICSEAYSSSPGLIRLTKKRALLPNFRQVFLAFISSTVLSGCFDFVGF